MSDSEELEEFNDVSEEVEKLREAALAINESTDSIILQKTLQITQEVHESLVAVNEFFQLYADSMRAITESLENENSSVSMPDEESAQNFIGLTNTAVSIMGEVAANTQEGGLPDEDFLEAETDKLKHLINRQLESEEITQHFRQTLEYYANSQSNNEELADENVTSCSKQSDNAGMAEHDDLTVECNTNRHPENEEMVDSTIVPHNANESNNEEMGDFTIVAQNKNELDN